MSKAFWVIELTETEKAPCPRYWSGNERGFVYDIGEAIQLVRKQDAERFLERSRISGHVAEHAMIETALSGSPQVEAGTVEACVKVLETEATKYLPGGPMDMKGLFRRLVAEMRALPRRPREQEGGKAPVAWEWLEPGGTWQRCSEREVAEWPKAPGYATRRLYAHPPLPADGWREGIEAAAKVAEGFIGPPAPTGAQIAAAIRALLPTPPASTEGV